MRLGRCPALLPRTAGHFEASTPNMEILGWQGNPLAQCSPLSKPANPRMPVPLPLLAKGSWTRNPRDLSLPEAPHNSGGPCSPAVDIALPEERIALEVDGPHHFTANTFRPLGEMFARWGEVLGRGAPFCWHAAGGVQARWGMPLEECTGVLMTRMFSMRHAAGTTFC